MLPNWVCCHSRHVSCVTIQVVPPRKAKLTGFHSKSSLGPRFLFWVVLNARQNWDKTMLSIPVLDSPFHWQIHQEGHPPSWPTRLISAHFQFSAPYHYPNGFPWLLSTYRSSLGWSPPQSSTFKHGITVAVSGMGGTTTHVRQSQRQKWVLTQTPTHRQADMQGDRQATT